MSSCAQILFVLKAGFCSHFLCQILPSFRDFLFLWTLPTISHTLYESFPFNFSWRHVCRVCRQSFLYYSCSDIPSWALKTAGIFFIIYTFSRADFVQLDFDFEIWIVSLLEAISNNPMLLTMYSDVFYWKSRKRGGKKRFYTTFVEKCITELPVILGQKTSHFQQSNIWNWFVKGISVQFVSFAGANLLVVFS